MTLLQQYLSFQLQEIGVVRSKGDQPLHFLEGLFGIGRLVPGISAGVAGGNAHIAFRIEPQCLRRIGNEAHKLGLYPFITRLQLWINRCVPCWVLLRSEEHTSELQSLMRSSYAVFCLQKNSHITSK